MTLNFGSDPNRDFQCECRMCPLATGFTGEKRMFWRRRATTNREIGVSARNLVIWYLIYHLNREPRRLTRRSRAAAPQNARFSVKIEAKLLASLRLDVMLAGSILSVQLFCEVAVLLLIVVAFVAAGVLSARRVSARLLGVDAASAAAATGRALRLQMVGTTAFVFVTFLIRSAFSTMFAVALKLRDIDKDCPGLEKFTYCGACYNDYTHMVGWKFYTPEFQSTIVMLSSPVALLVALWGMTSNATLQLMKSSGQESAMKLSMSLRLLK